MSNMCTVSLVASGRGETKKRRKTRAASQRQIQTREIGASSSPVIGAPLPDALYVSETSNIFLPQTAAALSGNEYCPEISINLLRYWKRVRAAMFAEQSWCYLSLSIPSPGYGYSIDFVFPRINSDSIEERDKRNRRLGLSPNGVANSTLRSRANNWLESALFRLSKSSISGAVSNQVVT